MLMYMNISVIYMEWEEILGVGRRRDSFSHPGHRIYVDTEQGLIQLDLRKRVKCLEFEEK